MSALMYHHITMERKGHWENWAEILAPLPSEAQGLQTPSPHKLEEVTSLLLTTNPSFVKLDLELSTSEGYCVD